LLYTSTHDTILFFTNKGKVYKKKGYQIPEYGRTAKGLPLVNLLEIGKDEKVTAVIRVEKFKEDAFFFFTTREGVSKRTPLTSYANIRQNGLIAISLREEDELISVKLTDGSKEIVIGTRDGALIRFPETDIREMGRTASGVRGIRLREDDKVVGMEILDPEDNVLVITEKGYGKQTKESEYRVQSRGGMGIKTCQITDKNGPLVAVRTVNGTEDIMLITVNGILIRMDVNDISTTGRSTQGVRLIRLGEDEIVATVAKVKKDIELPEGTDEVDENIEEALIEESAEADVYIEDEIVADETLDNVEEDPEEDEA
jgi:DNA gyrase subunit A